MKEIGKIEERVDGPLEDIKWFKTSNESEEEPFCDEGEKLCVYELALGLTNREASTGPLALSVGGGLI